MAITIIQERKKQRYLISALALIILVMLLILWLGFSRGREAASFLSAPPVIYAPPKVEIDWRILDDLRLQPLQPFEEIGTFEGEFGRKNPFIPY